MLDFLELEETVGRAWHRFIGDTRTWPRFPDEAVRLDDIQGVLAIYFRGLGGERAVQIAPARGRTSAHRLRLRQSIGLGEEKLVQPARDHATLMLPAEIDLFPARRLNRDLYFWLAATMATIAHSAAPRKNGLKPYEKRTGPVRARPRGTCAGRSATFDPFIVQLLLFGSHPG